MWFYLIFPLKQSHFLDYGKWDLYFLVFCRRGGGRISPPKKRKGSNNANRVGVSMKLSVKFFSAGMVYLFSSLACGNVVITGISYGSGTPGGVYMDNSPPGVGSYDMSQGTRGVASQKASCQSALNGFDKTFGNCYQAALDFEIDYISRAANQYLPKDQALYDSHVLVGDRLAGSKILACKNGYNESIANLNAGGCAGLDLQRLNLFLNQAECKCCLTIVIDGS
jgi:hypothetical protein